MKANPEAYNDFLKYCFIDIPQGQHIAKGKQYLCDRLFNGKIKTMTYDCSWFCGKVNKEIICKVEEVKENKKVISKKSLIKNILSKIKIDC